MSHCAVCSSASIQPIAEKDNYSFAQCKHCDFIFLDPMPSQEELSRQYLSKDNEPEPTYNKAGSRLRRAYMKLPRFLPYAWKQDVIDIGCGGGFITHVLSHVARSSTGVDISQDAISYAQSRFKQSEFICHDFPELLNTDKQYRFVYSSEVIEHVSDINLYMQVLQKITKPGGYVYITTPDSSHPLVPDNICEWDVFNPPVHVQFLNRKTATILFGKYNFSIIKFYKNRKPGLIFLARKHEV